MEVPAALRELIVVVVEVAVAEGAHDPVSVAQHHQWHGTVAGAAVVVVVAGATSAVGPQAAADDSPMRTAQGTGGCYFVVAAAVVVVVAAHGQTQSSKQVADVP